MSSYYIEKATKKNVITLFWVAFFDTTINIINNY